MNNGIKGEHSDGATDLLGSNTKVVGRYKWINETQPIKRLQEKGK